MKKIKRAQPILFVILTCLAIGWSWLFFIQVTQLTDSRPIGYLTALITYLVVITISMAIFGASVIYLQQEYLRQKTLSPWFLVKLFFVWAATEWAVSWCTAIVWYGKDGSFDTVFPFASLTPISMYTPLRFAARFLGFYGLSAAIVMLVAAVTFKKTRRYAPWAAGCLVLLSLGGWWLYRLPVGDKLKTVIVAEDLVNKLPAQTTDADLIVFPEYGLDNVGANQLQQRVVGAANKEVFFVGSQQQDGDMSQGLKDVHNVLIFGSTKQGYISAQTKARLAPAGEYLPYAVELPLRLAGATQTLQVYNFSRAVQKGTQPLKPLVLNSRTILGSEVCASIISTEDYRALTKQGATLLSNSASLGIFNGSPIFTTQHHGLARFMAVANARPLLQAADNSQAFALDQNGNLLKSAPPISEQAVVVQTNSTKTLYTAVGEWAVYIGVIIVLFDFGRWVVPRAKKTNKAAHAKR